MTPQLPSGYLLRDHLATGLKLVICGTAAGSRSANVGHYYAGRGNRLWNVLYSTGITSRLLSPEEDARLLEFGVGLTDIAKAVAGMDDTLSRRDWDVTSFLRKVSQYQPEVVCFNGKRAGQIVLGRQSVQYGFQDKSLGKTLLFIAPSTSGAARASWDESWWSKLAKSLLV